MTKMAFNAFSGIENPQRLRRTIRDGIIFSKDLHPCFLVTPMGEDLLENRKQQERSWAIIYDSLSGLTVWLCLPGDHATDLVQRKHGCRVLPRLT